MNDISEKPHSSKLGLFLGLVFVILVLAFTTADTWFSFLHQHSGGAGP